MVLVNGIDLNDGNMDMGKMKSVLDADVENIRNAKATVEKMIEEKMLGTEADNGSSLTYCYNQRGQLEEVKDWLGTTKIAMDEAGRIASVTDPYGKPWDMNGEAWARERQFFIQMEKRPYMNTMKPCRYRP